MESKETIVRRALRVFLWSNEALYKHTSLLFQFRKFLPGHFVINLDHLFADLAHKIVYVTGNM